LTFRFSNQVSLNEEGASSKFQACQMQNCFTNGGFTPENPEEQKGYTD
jgi:hypothetical protein